MPRHRDPPDGAGSHPPASAKEIAGWAVFIVPLTVGLLVVTGVGWKAAGLVGALGAAAAALLWLVGRRVDGARRSGDRRVE